MPSEQDRLDRVRIQMALKGYENWTVERIQWSNGCEYTYRLHRPPAVRTHFSLKDVEEYVSQLVGTYYSFFSLKDVEEYVSQLEGS